MRRKDREVTDYHEIMAIVERCDVCKLAMVDHDFPYIVPMNFGYSTDDGLLTLYFHGANEGKKINILKENPKVCFEMDCGHQMIIGETDCSYSMDYESVIGNGMVEFITSIDDKKFALAHIIKKYSKKAGFFFDEKLLDRITIFKIVSRDFVGKRHSS
nr:pyridoxamine 5'-phosphate oxidase family protein [uncultured Caproiciproducens sp.]